MSEEKSVVHRIMELTESVKTTIGAEMERLFLKMSVSEINALDTKNARFAKILLCSLDLNKLIENQYCAESMKSDVRKVRRIRNRNR
jgi:uncharacterized protein YdcH (DUF465 family)